MSNDKPMQGEFCWNELMTTDPSKAKNFYAALFNWDTDEINMEHGTYTIFKSDEAEIAGMMQTPTGQNIPSHWMSYIYVDNLEAITEKAQSLGGTIRVPITEVGDMGRFSVIVDPTGAQCAFWQSNDE